MSLEALLKAKLTGPELELLASKLQEITSDDVIKKDVIKKMMYKRSSLISVGEKILPIVNQTTLEETWYIPDTESVGGEFPVPDGATAKRSAPVQWYPYGIYMQIAEYRYMITYMAKARGRENWQHDVQVRAGSDFFRRCIDEQILDAVYAGAGATDVDVAVGNEWDVNGANMDVEGDIMKAWETIVDESNVAEEEMGEVWVIYPTKVDSKLRGLKLIGNISRSLKDYLKGSFSFNFATTRYYDETGTTKMQDDAIMIVKSRETGVHVKYTGGVIPLSETDKISGRGMEYLVKQIFGTKIVPESGTVTTNPRICLIKNVI